MDKFIEKGSIKTTEYLNYKENETTDILNDIILDLFNKHNNKELRTLIHNNKDCLYIFNIKRRKNRYYVMSQTTKCIVTLNNDLLYILTKDEQFKTKENRISAHKHNLKKMFESITKNYNFKIYMSEFSLHNKHNIMIHVYRKQGIRFWHF
jgi:hypothetical protein